jgi:uncharacterized protein
MMKKLFALFTALLAFAPFAHAQTPSPNPRVITVVGEAEIKVTPDEALLTLGVETLGKDLEATKKQNDTAIAKALESIVKNGVKREDVKTDFINIEPQYQETQGRRTLSGFLVRRTLAVIVRDFAKLSTVLTDALKAGVNVVYGLQFQTSKLLEYRQQARSLAVKAAKQKAEALAGELGQRVGDPLNITETGSGAQPYQVNTRALAQEAVPSSETFTPGQISVTASVTISFELVK